MSPCFQQATGGALTRKEPEVLQINVGKLCNQRCVHCHVDAGPERREVMERPVAEACIDLLERFPGIHTLDITGGAPEMNPHFRHLAEQASRRGLHVIDRCNLTILTMPGFEDLVDFLADHRVHVIASLPCYMEENVEKQRGKDVFRRSIDALQRLNAAGYGREDGLILDLVYNPQGLGLPPAESVLEPAYKEHLGREFGVVFNSLLSMANIPISRFGDFLQATDQYDKYVRKLADAFNEATVPGLMCRNTLNASWDGYIYDCDFNQMLDWRLGAGEPLRVETVTPEALAALPIQTGEHCFGCTAGAGSSCAGSLTGK